MNHKLPFALSAIGLISLAIYQPAVAQQAGPSLTIEIPSGEPGPAQPPAGVFTFDGAPVAFVNQTGGAANDENGNPLFVRIPNEGLSAQARGLFSNRGSLISLGVSVSGDSAAEAAASAVYDIEAHTSRGLVFLGLVFDSDLTSLMASASPAAPGRLTATPSDVSNSVIANSFADPSAVLSSVQNAVAGSVVENAAGATLATSANSLTARATVNSQTASQTIATGEDSLAVAALATTTDQTTSTATVADSVVGLRIDNGGTLSGATSVTVDGNSLSATARSNDSTSALIATGANSGATGNSAAGPDADNTYPAPGALTLNGDLLATGVQRIDAQSNVTATLSNGVIGIRDTNGGATIDAIGGGVSVSGNTASAVADGNRLGLSLTDNLSGGDVDSTAYALQTLSDTNVTATAGSTVGVSAETIDGSSLVVATNNLQAAASGNRTTATVTARPDGASDSLVTDVEQFVRASANAVDISAGASNSLIGRSSATSTGVNSSVTDNRLTAVALGNEQTTSADLGQGVQAGTARVEGNQTLVLDGNDLRIAALVQQSVIGSATLGGNDSGATTTVDGNTAIAQSVGNLASQSLGDNAGARQAALTVEQTQTAQGSASNSLALGAGISELGLGATASGNLEAPTLTVSDNQVAGLISLNRSNQSLGGQSGSSSAAGALTVALSQTADSADASASASDLRLGVLAVQAITQSATAATANLTVTGNQASVQAELNRSLQSLAGVNGAIGGAVELNSNQTANAAAGGLSSVGAMQSGTGLGIYGGTGSIDVDGGRFDLTVSGNQVSTQAQANLAQSALGDVSGSIDLGAGQRLGASIEQATADTAATALNLDIGLGITNSAPTGTLFQASTDEVNLSITGNSVQALARQNNGSIATGVIAGQITQGDLRSRIEQTSTAGLTNASNSGVFAGVTPAVAANDLGLGNAGGSTSLTVSGNTVRADAADNLATVVASGVNGTVGANATVGAVIEQTSTGAQVNALNSFVDLGAAEQNGFSVGAGGIAVTVTDNSSVAVASGNNSTASLGGVSGGIATGGTASVSTTQSFDDGQVTAATGIVKAGVTDANLGDAAGSASLSVSSNAVVTAASGNDSRVVDLGNSAAAIDGTLSASSTQTMGANASLGATADNLQIGAAGIGNLGSASAASVSVSDNAVTTSATANNSNVSGSLSGTLAGQVAINATQTLNGSASGITAATGTVGGPNLVGVQADTLGGNASASVAGNTVTSAVAGNRVLNNLGGAAFANATGTLGFGATQAINGANVATGDLRSEVTNTTVGVVGGDNSVLAAQSVSGNRLVATTTGNDVARTLNGLSGNFNAATTAVTMADAQTTSDAVLVATVGSSRIGTAITSDAAVPGSLTVNGNAVVAQAIANNSSQLVSLNGVSTTGGPLTSLNAGQSLLNSSVRAEVTNVTVGFSNLGVAPGAGNFTGAAVAAGNSVSASAIGNQSTQIRSGR